MKKWVIFSCLLFRLFLTSPSTFAQQEVEGIFGIPIALYTWDRNIPLDSFIYQCAEKNSTFLILIGYNSTSVFTVESSVYDSGEGDASAIIAETDTSGKRKTWSTHEIFGYNAAPQNDSPVSWTVMKPTHSIDFKTLKRAEIWAEPRFASANARVNIKELKTAFTFSLFNDESEDPHYPTFYFIAKTEPFSYFRSMDVVSSQFTVPIPCQVKKNTDDDGYLIFGKDTIHVQLIKNNQDFFPFAWADSLLYESDSTRLLAEKEITLANDSLKKQFPIIQTHPPKVHYIYYWDQFAKQKVMHQLLVFSPEKWTENCSVYVLQIYDSRDKIYELAEMKCRKSKDLARNIRMLCTMR